MADCFQPELRGKVMALYALAPVLGPEIGPIAGGFNIENTTWRWCFYTMTIRWSNANIRITLPQRDPSLHTAPHEGRAASQGYFRSHKVAESESNRTWLSC